MPGVEGVVAGRTSHDCQSEMILLTALGEGLYEETGVDIRDRLS
jgi:hypothetical protein